MYTKRPGFIAPGRLIWTLPVLIAVITGLWVWKGTSLQTYLQRNASEKIKSIGTSILSPSGPWVEGLDLSHHQRHIDWELLTRENKPAFIFFKATEGTTHQDSRYHNYIKEGRKRDILSGAYHFFSYTSPGESQAKNFIKTARLKSGDLFPVLDVEFRRNMPSDAWIISNIATFCNEIEKEYGIKPIIYCECDYYEKYLQIGFSDYAYWISDMHRTPRCNWILWQYTDKAEIRGIRGGVDKNRVHPETNLLDYILK
jgi:lysozyme